MLASLEFGDYAIIAFIVAVISGGVSFVGRQQIDLRRLERKLDALLKHEGVQPAWGLSEEVQRLARTPGQKIAALKLHREQTGAALAEAKVEIEAFIGGKQ